MSEDASPNPRIRFVLVRTSHPGNIGAAARAIRTMGFERLDLVAPHKFPHPDAVAMASGANAVLDNAAIAPTLVDAMGGELNGCKILEDDIYRLLRNDSSVVGPMSSQWDLIHGGAGSIS